MGLALDHIEQLQASVDSVEYPQGLRRCHASLDLVEVHHSLRYRGLDVIFHTQRCGALVSATRKMAGSFELVDIR